MFFSTFDEVVGGIMDKSKSILVVDDEAGIRFLLSEFLSSKGFRVSMAKDGQESLDQLERDHFDLVITDLNMPRLDGISMLKKMEAAGRKEKVIIMSGNLSDHRLNNADISGVVPQLEKPFMMNNFLNLVIATIANNEMA